MTPSFALSPSKCPLLAGLLALSGIRSLVHILRDFPHGMHGRLVKLVLFSSAVHMGCFASLSSLKFAVGSVQVTKTGHTCRFAPVEERLRSRLSWGGVSQHFVVDS